MNDSFSPLTTLKETLRWWWLVVLLAVGGAGAGWIFHRLQVPLYDAQAAFSVVIDFGRTGDLNDAEEDQMFMAVSDVITSEDVLTAASRRAGAEGIDMPVKVGDILSIERRYQDWMLQVRNPDPQAAARMANLWAEEAGVALEAAQMHAMVADQLLRRLDALSDCIAKSANLEPVQPFCSLNNLAQIQQELSDTGKVAWAERDAAQGISPALSITLVEQAAVPTTPAIYKRSMLIFYGLFLGFLIGIGLIGTGIPSRLAERKRAH